MIFCDLLEIVVLLELLVGDCGVVILEIVVILIVVLVFVFSEFLSIFF